MQGVKDLTKQILFSYDYNFIFFWLGSVLQIMDDLWLNYMILSKSATMLEMTIDHS